MDRHQTFREFVVEYYLKKGRGLYEWDKASVFAEDLWYRAAHGDKKAKMLLGKLAKRYNKRELA